MARASLTLDASVGVKWFSPTDERDLAQALAVRDACLRGAIIVVVPDLFYYEVANALTYKKSILVDDLQQALGDLFGLRLQTVSVDASLLLDSVKRAREFKLSVYDACYVSVAVKYACPLVTANPRHQGQVPDCEVVPIERWRAPA